MKQMTRRTEKPGINLITDGAEMKSINPYFNGLHKMKYLSLISVMFQYHIQYKTHILHIFPIENLRCVLNLRVSYIRSNMVYKQTMSTARTCGVICLLTCLSHLGIFLWITLEYSAQKKHFF
jgi:hypothetical protein